MAKKVYRVAEFEPCTNVVPSTFDLLARVSLLAPLPPKTKENIEKCRGALRMRRFAAGDVICRQGEEDCTAFYILKTEDLQALRKYPEQKRTELETEKGSVQKQLENTALPPKKAKDLQDRLAALDKQLEELPALVATIQDTIDGIEVPREQLAILARAGVDYGRANAVDEHLAAVLAVCRAREDADKELERAQKAAESAGDKARAALVQDVRQGDTVSKRGRAIELAEVDAALAQPLKARALAEELRHAANAVLTPAGRQTRRGFGAWLRGIGRHVASRLSAATGAPLHIPFDGPTDLDYQTRTAPLKEGDLFGEMACMNRAPRSASVVAARDCYMLEMLSNVLAEIDKDPQYRKQRDEEYKRRVFDLQLRDLSVFRTLTDDQFAQVFRTIRNRLELLSYPSGSLICDEHERSDSVYLVRSGLVQVRRNVSALLAVDDVLDWQALAAALKPDGAAAALSKLLPVEVQELLARPPEELSADDKLAIVYAVNDLIGKHGLATLPDFPELSKQRTVQERLRRQRVFQARRVYNPKELNETVETASVREYSEKLPEKTEQWSELDQRRLERLVLEEMLPGCLRRWRQQRGPDVILNYCSRGDFIGEIGVFLNQPRTATCIAYDQPQGPQQEDLGRVEVVRLPADVFRHLVETFPAVRENVERAIGQRQQGNVGRLQPKQAKAEATGLLSEKADRLGLVQGQRLMLVDLERCTQCGECTRACQDAHEDGRSRLFLYGHRFENYLVPITCRSCLDPVCMVGCPVRSIQRGDNQQMQIKDWCIGCGVCAKNCPYDAIKMHGIEVKEATDAPEGMSVIQFPRVAVVCDLCSDLPGNAPRCVYACPHEAAIRINARVGLPVIAANGGENLE